MGKCCCSTLRQLEVELVLNSFLPARPPAAAEKGLTVALGWTYTAISDHPCDWTWGKCGGFGSKALVLHCTARQVEECHGLGTKDSLRWNSDCCRDRSKWTLNYRNEANYILFNRIGVFSWCNLHTANVMWYLILWGIDVAHALTNYIVFPLKYLNGH